MNAKPRDILFWLHLVVGVIVGAVIFIMAATGMIMAFEPQIVELAEESVRIVDVPNQTPRLDLKTIVAKAEMDQKDKATGLTLESNLARSIIVNFRREDAVFVNPYTGAILGGQSKIREFMHTVENIHRWLGNRDIGRPVTGVSVMAFFFLLLSGIYLWWPVNWHRNTLKAITRFHGKAKGRARDWNWHNVIGFWAAPLILITTITGTIMAHQWANNLLYCLAGSEPPAAGVRPNTSPRNTERARSEKKEKREFSLVDFDGVVARVGEKVFAWESLSIRLPQKVGGLITVSIQESNTIPSNARSQLSLDSVTLEIKKWEPFDENSLGRQLRVWVKSVHTGEAGGIIGQAFSFTSATAAMFLVYTGFAMAGRRFFIKDPASVKILKLKRSGRRK